MQGRLFLSGYREYKKYQLMNFQNFFQPAPSISPDEVRNHFKTGHADDYCLLDVRQPMENAQVRLPGSVLIPLGELNIRLGELDPGKPTIVYCRSGNRSVSATNFLLGQGFSKVLNMEGGIIRYNGMIASGPPEAASACFRPSLTASQLAATAWVLEDGAIRFIEQLCHEVLEDHEPAIFDHILEAKRAHQTTLSELAGEITGQGVSETFPGSEIDLPEEPAMIGCVKVAEALKWAMNKRLKDLLEMMMTMSANAYDFYLRLGRAAVENEERRVFEVLATEEHQHLERLTKAYEQELYTY